MHAAACPSVSCPEPPSARSAAAQAWPPSSPRMIGGIFGMNMPLPKKLQVSETAFIWVTFYTCFTGFVMFVGFVVFARWKRLLFIPSAGLGDR